MTIPNSFPRKVAALEQIRGVMDLDRITALSHGSVNFFGSAKRFELIKKICYFGSDVVASLSVVTTIDVLLFNLFIVYYISIVSSYNTSIVPIL